MHLLPSSEQFTEVDREALAKILRDPLLTRAINTAIREALPTAHTLVKLSPEAQAALANQGAGMTELVRRLQLLSTPTTQLGPAANFTDIGEWTYIDDDDNPNHH